jgi:hypothetical protein
MEDTITLTASDTNFKFQSYQGEEVWLSAAKKLSVNWAKAPDMPNVWVTDLSGQDVKEISGLRIDQKRAVRARYPNGCDSNKSLPSG